MVGFGVGGAERPDRAVSQLVSGTAGRVVIVTWAGESTGSINIVGGGQGVGNCGHKLSQ